MSDGPDGPAAAGVEQNSSATEGATDQAEDRVAEHARRLRVVTLRMMPEPALPERGHPRGSAR